MSEVDALTGLPALPEGQFWRVRETDWYYDGRTRAKFAVEIIERYTTVKTYTTKRRFRKDITTEEVVEATRRISYEDVYILVSAATKSKEGVFDYDLTPESIRISAARVVERREKARIEEARKAELLGDYPPKTLKKEEK